MWSRSPKVALAGIELAGIELTKSRAHKNVERL
jgi:hypothetical protein